MLPAPKLHLFPQAVECIILGPQRNCLNVKERHEDRTHRKWWDRDTEGRWIGN
jgi:hypothetical protein